MQTHFVFRQMESSNALRGYTEERLEKIKRYFADPLRISCTFSVEKIHHIAEVEVVLRNGLQLHASESTENMYSSVDMALAKMERQVRRYKDRIRHHKAHEGRSAKVRLGVLAAERETDQLLVQEAPPTAEPTDAEVAEETRPEVTILRVSEIETERLTVDQAIMQMNLVHKAFYVFTNADTGAVNVIYRRDVDTYGLIEAAGDDAEPTPAA
ncbi:MAG: ribosome-associated translation inhibitor RaiA [Myxococcales bacterium]|nr:ribosome-associated translation inhibitor RaiA [Myxococcales bacterium]